MNTTKPSSERTLEEIRDALQEFLRLFNDFAKAYLNAKFPYGRPTDRWRPR